MPITVHEPARETPVAYDADLCIVGGSCTGVFAAVRAARLGLRVALIEANSILGGMAVAAQVTEWQSIYDAYFDRVIIGGLSIELMDRLKRRRAVEVVPKGHRAGFRFNAAEMAVELDELVRENGIRLFLNARCVTAIREGDVIRAAVLEDKGGRRAVTAKVFVDASGDGDLLRQGGFDAYKRDTLQPANLQAIVAGYEHVPGDQIAAAIKALADEYGYPTANSLPWPNTIPDAPLLRNVFGPRVNGVDTSDADQLTDALVNNRRYHRALCELLEKFTGSPLTLVSFAPMLGIRETFHAACQHSLTTDELLSGEQFPDAIANGTYPVDIHSATGTFLRYLDGRDEIVATDGTRRWERWRDESVTPRCYHVPFRSLIPKAAANVLIAGRLIDADPGAFGAVRVMVTTNQMGEAVGVASALAVRDGVNVGDVDPTLLRKTLADGGAIVL
ncbi:MAG TPA: FAD-dependent oxidoreductase [Capsulimonadaceae bacterium]|jgi:hypothetical protein